MTIFNVYLIFWGPFKFGGPVRSHGPHVPRYGPASVPAPLPRVVVLGGKARHDTPPPS